MREYGRRAALVLMLSGVAGCRLAPERERERNRNRLHPGESPEVRRLITRYADLYDVPRGLVHRVVQRESGYNPAARNGPYYGLMQILPQTAATMGHRGPPKSLLNADTNLRFGVKYLRGAYLVADGDQDAAIGWYSRGYYYEAKRLGLLEETGLR
ncbi:MAG: lytic transglycosylase domain-containing protein [Paracoccaceae bacterium]